MSISLAACGDRSEALRQRRAHATGPENPQAGTSSKPPARLDASIVYVGSRAPQQERKTHSLQSGWIKMNRTIKTRRAGKVSTSEPVRLSKMRDTSTKSKTLDGSVTHKSVKSTPKPHSALQRLSRQLNEDPCNERLLARRAGLYKKAGRHEEAAADLVQAEELTNARFERIRVLSEQLLANKRDVSVLSLRSKEYSALGLNDLARKDLRRAAKGIEQALHAKRCEWALCPPSREEKQGYLQCLSSLAQPIFLALGDTYMRKGLSDTAIDYYMKNRVLHDKAYNESALEKALDMLCRVMGGHNE